MTNLHAEIGHHPQHCVAHCATAARTAGIPRHGRREHRISSAQKKRKSHAGFRAID